MSSNYRNYRNNNSNNNYSESDHMVLPLTGRQVSDMVFLMEGLTVSQRRELLTYGRGLKNNMQQQTFNNQQQFNNNQQTNNNQQMQNRGNNSNNNEDPRYIGKKKYNNNKPRFQPNNKRFQQQQHQNNRNNAEETSSTGAEDQQDGGQSKSQDWADMPNDDEDQGNDLPDIPVQQKPVFKKKQATSTSDQPKLLKRREQQPSEEVQDQPKEDLAV